VFYVEHTRHLFPKPGEAQTEEEDHLTRAMVPVVYFLVLFSIVVHGLSIPALDAYYRWKNIAPITEEGPAEIRVLSDNDALPNNAFVDSKRKSVVMHNRFSRPNMAQDLSRWRDPSGNMGVNPFDDKREMDPAFDESPVYPTHMLQPSKFDYARRV
jgi:sodium/hydrogen antiporter